MGVFLSMIELTKALTVKRTVILRSHFDIYDQYTLANYPDLL